MPVDLKPLFERLLESLRSGAQALVVSEDTTTRYVVEGPVGPATLQAWSGKLKRERIPMAWVQIEKSYVSFHVMGVYGDPKLSANMSKELARHTQGKICFKFKGADEGLFKELDELTGHACQAFRRAGFIQLCGSTTKKL